jgi:ribosomal protein L11 methyltransferase
MLARATRPGGSLILSGILARQSDELLTIYGPLTLHLGPLAVLRERDGWVCLGTLGAPGATSGARGQGSAHS